MKRDGFVRVAACLTAVVVGVQTLAAGQQLTKEDVAKLAAAGVGDEVIICKIKAAGAVFDLSTDDILTLKQAKVSDTVIAAMLRTKIESSATPTTTATAPAVPVPTTEPETSGGIGIVIRPSESEATFAALEVVVSNQPMVSGLGEPRASVLLSNQTGRKLSLLIDEVNGRITYFPGSMPHMVGLARDEVKSLSLRPGEYSIRWTGKPACLRIQAPANRLLKLAATEQDRDGHASVLLSVFEGDVAVGSAFIFDEPTGQTLSGSEASLSCKEPPVVVAAQVSGQAAALCGECGSSGTPTVVNNYYYNSEAVTSPSPIPVVVGPVTWPQYTEQVMVCPSPVWTYPTHQHRHYVAPRLSHPSNWRTYPARACHHHYHQYRRSHEYRSGDLLGGLLTPNTIFWGGVGALVGDRKNEAGQGAAIGAAFGLLLDWLAER